MDYEKIDRFWRETLAELASVPIDAEVEESDPEGIMHEGVKTVQNHSVRMSSFEGAKIRGWYTVPIGEAPAGGWPAIVTLPGYFGIQPLPTHFVRHGYATLCLYPRSQGESLKEWEIEHSTRLTYNATDPYKYYYRAAYADCVRGVDFLCSRDEVDSERIGVWGMSQGGGLALALAALDNRIKVASSEVAWPCNFPIAAEWEIGPYNELRDLIRENPSDRETIMSTLEYFDPLNLARRIKCRVLMNGSMTDDIHPLNTIVPVYEQIQSMKALMIYPDLEHGTRADFSRHSLEWFDRYVH